MTSVERPPLFGDEHAMLLAFLDLQRDTLLWKLEGLSEAQLRTDHQPSGMSMLGLLKHLIRVEQTWFAHRLKGEPSLGQSNDDSAWSPTNDETYEELLGQYKAAWEALNAIARELPLNAAAVIPSEKYGSVSLQWVLLHMIEEYARHCGHADFLREAIDGETGYTRLIR